MLILAGAARPAETGTIPPQYLQRSPVQRHALIIGVETYDAIEPVPSVATDLDRIGSALRRQGFAQQTTLRNPTYCQTLREIVAFGQRVKQSSPDGNAIALVYFAGHGLHHGYEQWLAPRDFPAAPPISLLTSAVPVSWITEALDHSGAGGTLLLVDACRNDPLPQGPFRPGAGLASAASASGCVVDPPGDIAPAARVFDPFDVAGVATVPPPARPKSATYQCYSTRLGQLSSSPASGRAASAYADAFVEEIATPAIGVAEWMTNVKAHVEQRTGGLLTPMCEDHAAPLYSIDTSEASVEDAVSDWRRALGADPCQIRKLIRNRPVSPVRAGMLAWLAEHADAVQQCAIQAGTFPLLLSQTFDDGAPRLTSIEVAGSVPVLASQSPGARVLWRAGRSEVFRTSTPLSSRWATVQTPNGSGFVRLPADLAKKFTVPFDWSAPGDAQLHAEIRLPSGEHVALRRFISNQPRYIAQDRDSARDRPPRREPPPRQDNEGLRITLDVRALCADAGAMSDCTKLQALAERVLPKATAIEILSVARHGKQPASDNDAAFVAALHLQSALAGMGIAPARVPLQEQSSAWADANEPALAGRLLLRFSIDSAKPSADAPHEEEG